MTDMFQSLMINFQSGKTRIFCKHLNNEDLLDNDLLEEISHFRSNYKDGLPVSGKSRVAQEPPINASTKLPATIISYILCQIVLVGVDRVMAPLDRREHALKYHGRHLESAKLALLTTVKSFALLPVFAEKIIKDQMQSGAVIKISREY